MADPRAGVTGSDQADVRDFLCFDSSKEGFICNEKPQHEGDHIAWAANEDGTGRYEARRWPDA